MHLAVFGATGGTGQQLVKQAVDQGHTVVALARTPDKLAPHPNLTIVKGDVLDPLRVAETVAGVEAVVCTLGKTGENPDNVVSKGTRHIIQAMQAHGIGRLIVVTSLGVGDSKDQVSAAFKLVAKTALRKVMADKEIQEEFVRTSRLEWTIVRPGGLADGPKSNGAYTAGTDKLIKAGRITRADVADFILQELQEGEYIGRAVAVT